MKKIFLILSFFLLISCSRYYMINVHERVYTDEASALKDVYGQLHKYEVDSIPLNDWITNIMMEDTVTIEQRILRKTIDKHTNYTFVLTEYIDPKVKCVMCPERVKYYQYTVRFQGKK